MRNKISDKFFLFLKGFLMGICDLIPGISGGTIAFITGIYEELMTSVSSIPNAFYSLLRYLMKRDEKSKKGLKKIFEKINWIFLLVLIAGILLAFLLFSRVIKFLLENYFSYTIAFFIGLVLASSKIIFNNIQNHKARNILFGVLGFLIGILFSILIPLNIENPSMYHVFFGGFVAISAMFLPGISGAFILLILGLYEFIINALGNIAGNLGYLSVFILGVILGAFVISKVILLLFKKDRCKVLYFLLGLVIGSLSIPVKRISEAITLNCLNIIMVIFFVIIGIFLVLIVNSIRTYKTS